MTEEEALGVTAIFLISTVVAYCRGYSSGYAAATIERRR